MSRLASCLVVLSLSSATAIAEPPDVIETGWTRLVFETSKPIADLRVELRFASAAHHEPSVAIDRLSSTLSSHASWPIPDTEFRGVVKFRHDDGAALERVREKVSGGRYRKIFTFTQDGVMRVKVRPAGRSEKRGPPEDWSDRSERHFAYPPDRGGCETIVDPTMLLLAASSPRLASGEAGDELCVFNKKRIHRVRLRRIGIEQVELRDRTVRARRIEIHATPVAGLLAPEPLEFLGIEGDFEILIDEETDLPVSLRGRVNVFGLADFRLTEFEVGGAPP